MINIHKLHLPERPFRAIKNGSKKIEARAGEKSPNKYELMKAGDILVFEHEETKEILKTEIQFVHHYTDSRTMLETENIYDLMSSSPKTVEHGIESLNSFSGYKERIAKYGIYAIGVGLI